MYKQIYIYISLVKTNQSQELRIHYTSGVLSKSTTNKQLELLLHLYCIINITMEKQNNNIIKNSLSLSEKIKNIYIYIYNKEGKKKTVKSSPQRG